MACVCHAAGPGGGRGKAKTVFWSGDFWRGGVVCVVRDSWEALLALEEAERKSQTQKLKRSSHVLTYGGYFSITKWNGYSNRVATDYLLFWIALMCGSQGGQDNQLNVDQVRPFPWQAWRASSHAAGAHPGTTLISLYPPCPSPDTGDSLRLHFTAFLLFVCIYFAPCLQSPSVSPFCLLSESTPISPNSLIPINFWQEPPCKNNKTLTKTTVLITNHVVFILWLESCSPPSILYSLDCKCFVVGAVFKCTGTCTAQCLVFGGCYWNKGGNAKEKL